MIKNHLLQNAINMQCPNKGGKLKAPTLIVIHYTAGRSAEGSAAWLCDPAAKASAHVVVGRDGKIIQLVPFDTVAWHAGPSIWKGKPKCNNFSIGIEMDNVGFLEKQPDGTWRSMSLGLDIPTEQVMEAQCKGWQIYTVPQLTAVTELCRELISVYPSLVEVAGHQDVCDPPGRKSDPGPAFNMSSFRVTIFAVLPQPPAV